MKKLILIALIVIIAFTYFYFEDVKTLEIEKEYTLVNEVEEKIPATLFYRNINVEVNRKTENVHEILIFFDKELKMNFNPIVVVPKYKLIGAVEGGESGFLKLGNKVFQLSEDSNKFTTLDNSNYFNDTPVNKITFTEKSISFNSFDGLKDYGDIIILKK